MIYRTIFISFLLTSISIYSQNINFVDPEFKTLLVSVTPNSEIAKNLAGNFTKVDTNGDGEIQVSEAENISYIFIINNQKIKDFGGFQYFKNVNYLNLLYLGSLENLDLSKNTLIETLSLRSCYNLLMLDLSKNTALKSFTMNNANKLKILDFSANVNLESLYLFDNMLSLENLIVKNGKTQSFGQETCNYPKLSYVCCDESEKDFFLNRNIPNVVTDCMLSIPKDAVIGNLTFYPNPADHQIKFSEKVDEVKIYSTNGTLVVSKKLGQDILSTNELSAGNYFLELKLKGKTFHKKLLKK